MDIVLMCNALPVLFLLLYLASKKSKNRALFSVCFSLCTLSACGAFIYMQTVLNTPDVGKEFQQFYLPIGFYLCFCAAGVFLFFKARKRNQ